MTDMGRAFLIPKRFRSPTINQSNWFFLIKSTSPINLQVYFQYSQLFQCFTFSYAFADIEFSVQMNDMRHIKWQYTLELLVTAPCVFLYLPAICALFLWCFQNLKILQVRTLKKLKEETGKFHYVVMWCCCDASS